MKVESSIKKFLSDVSTVILFFILRRPKKLFDLQVFKLLILCHISLLKNISINKNIFLSISDFNFKLDKRL